MPRILLFIVTCHFHRTSKKLHNLGRNDARHYVADLVIRKKNDIPFTKKLCQLFSITQRTAFEVFLAAKLGCKLIYEKIDLFKIIPRSFAYTPAKFFSSLPNSHNNPVGVKKKEKKICIYLEKVELSALKTH